MKIESQVQRIIRAVRRHGDTALFSYTHRFDGWRPTSKTVVVKNQEWQSASKKLPASEWEALKKAAARIRKFHERQRMKSWWMPLDGINVGTRWSPIEKVGIYVPGGRAAYPSTVLMTAIPASVAGVKEIVIVTPAPRGIIPPSILVAAKLAGVKKIYKVGGAQGVAALAFGTRSIPKVDKIVGPGNAYVAEAKRQVFGKVAIDMIAGPTELVIIADQTANPSWVAADLISQAEHDPEARPILISPSAKIISGVAEEVRSQLKKTDRRQIAKISLKRQGRLIKVKSLDEACTIANEIAPEHLSLHVARPSQLAKKIKHAGAIFLGGLTPVAFGDYVAGPSHVLPTAGTARFSSPLGVYDFMKGTSFIEATKSGFKKLAPVVRKLATLEGLTAHADAVAVRL